jgi:hypothetical protein
MNEHTTFSARASLMVVGQMMQQMRMWDTVRESVYIGQKVIEHHPLDKLLDAFIGIVAGGHGLYEINTRVRSDRALQRAFGRRGCAEQSVVSDTLNACTAQSVEQMREAVKRIYQQHGQGYRHDYEQSYQVLDLDLSGLPAGRQAEGSTKGYFAGKPHCRGRQVGRVIATRYDEVVIDRLYQGSKQLRENVQELVQAAEATLDLDHSQRQRTLLRLDRGGGDQKQIDWMLERDYCVLTKCANWFRAHKLAATVTTWQIDPDDPARAFGWPTAPADYARPTQQVVVRILDTKGKISYGLLVTNAPFDLLVELATHPVHDLPDPHLFAIVYAYDRRNGSIETQFKNSKQGLGLSKRNKRSFPAQEMLVLLALLAHNLTVWTRNHLALAAPSYARLGTLRMVRDVFHIPGRILFDPQGHLRSITLNRDHPFARFFVAAFASFCAQQNDLSLILGQI